MRHVTFILTLLVFVTPMRTTAQETYTVNTNSKKPIAPAMWGLFYEDINRSGDGGIYAELVKNRSFDFPDPFMGWQVQPSRGDYARNDIFQIINQSSTDPDNPKYLQVVITKPNNYFLANEGFGGVTVQKEKQYSVTMRYRQAKDLRITTDIVNSSGKSVGNATLNTTAGDDWQLTTVTITTNDSTSTGKFVVRFEGTGSIDIDRLSLFPLDTWQQKPGGLRADLVQKLADMKPGFLRFPGGCIVEGEDIATRYQWKKTIGPLEQRKLNSNQWSTGGASGKAMPDYFQSYGLGFLEYFQLCEDIGAEPMPIINAGLSCQFGAGEVIPAGEMDAYIQDALDLIEFANGDAGSTWGAKRIEYGHTKPFNLKMLGVGNENWGPQYVERLQLFTKAIKAKYPQIQIITATGYSPNPQFRYMDSVLRKLNVDIIDEHYYQTANWFFMNAGKYDKYDRKGPKIFLGEYACHSVRIGNTGNRNTQLCALAEAAFMTGLERNSDIVIMAAYAPLFAHVNDWQWTPNLIWFDNSSSYATPSYYVQQLFALNRGTHSVALTAGDKSISGQDSVWASAAIDETKKQLIIKIVNSSAKSKDRIINIPGIKSKTNKVEIISLQSDDPSALNSIQSPDNIRPVTTSGSVKNKNVAVTLKPYSFSVIKLSL